jgi:hypothetical protein
VGDNLALAPRGDRGVNSADNQIERPARLEPPGRMAAPMREMEACIVVLSDHADSDQPSACIWCRRMAVPLDAHGQCSVCEQAPKRIGCPDDAPGERAAFLAQCGIPADANVALYYYWSEELLPTAPGYQVEALSVPTRCVPRSAWSAPWPSPAPPHLGLLHSEPHAVLRWRVFRADMPGFLEVRWSFDGERWRLDDFDPTKLDAATRLIKHAQVALRRGGRPPKLDPTDPESREKWIVIVTNVIAVLVAQNERVSVRSIACVLQWDRDTIGACCRALDVDIHLIESNVRAKRAKKRLSRQNPPV